MNYLLDTHAFLWFINDDPTLSIIAKSLIEDPENRILLSFASIWEMAIKVSLNKLVIPPQFDEFIDKQLQENYFDLLDIKLHHVNALVTMPFHHRDPFDRLLIAQSQEENLPIISKDTIFDAYQIERYW